MDELYQIIEQKIKASGYPREISGAKVYNDICDQIEGKENGEYLLLSKFEDDVVLNTILRWKMKSLILEFWLWKHRKVYLKQILMQSKILLIFQKKMWYNKHRAKMK